MLNIVLFAGKILFLVVLYLFIYWVVRSALRESRSAAAAPNAAAGLVSAVAVGEHPAPRRQATEAPSGRLDPGTSAHGRGGHRGWTLTVARSRELQRGRRFEVMPGVPVLVGRATDADLQLGDTFVSSHHARFLAGAQGLSLEDLGSTNGTTVNGEDVVGQVWLRPGDEVAIGDSAFTVRVA
jgi:hypothetical protein